MRSLVLTPSSWPQFEMLKAEVLYLRIKHDLEMYKMHDTYEYSNNKAQIQHISHIMYIIYCISYYIYVILYICDIIYMLYIKLLYVIYYIL